MPARSSWAARKLSWAQRYQFLSGWLPWISDGLGLIVTLFALLWTFLMALEPRYFDVPMAALSAAALALFAAKTLKTLLLYPQKVRSGVLGAVMASTAGLALTHTCGKAVIAGLFTSRKPFLRTPKCEDPADFGQVLRQSWQEATLFALCMLALVATALGPRLRGSGGAIVDGDAVDPVAALFRDHRHGGAQRLVQRDARRKPGWRRCPRTSTPRDRALAEAA